MEGGQIVPLPPGSAGPAHIVEARPDPLNIGGPVGTRKQLELKMYLRGPQGNQITVVAFQHVCTFGARFIFTKKSNVAKYFFDIFHGDGTMSSKNGHHFRKLKLEKKMIIIKDECIN